MRVGSQSTLQQGLNEHSNPSAAITLPADSEDSDSFDSDRIVSSLVEDSGSAPETDNGAQKKPIPIVGATTAPIATPASTLALNGLMALLGSSSGQLQPAFMLKTMPANPQTTKQEANSIILKEGRTNALAVNTSIVSSSGSVSPPMTPNAKNDFKSSVRIWQQQTELEDMRLQDESQDQISEEASSWRKTITNLASSPIFKTSSNAQLELRAEIGPDGVASPKIITYRKTNHQRTESDNYDASLREERYDPKLYVNEKYADTVYRYATMKRNVEFHQLFRSLDLTDRLLDDFACALSREILLQGRIYITEHSVCFNLNLLGWVTSLVIPFEDIIRIEKKSTAGLFPNGITVETSEAKHNFASFLSRDATYDFIRAIWLSSTGRKLEDLDLLLPSSDSAANEEQKLINARKISNYILSIDDDEQNHLLWDKNGVDYEDEDEDASEDDDDEDDDLLSNDEEDDDVNSNGDEDLSEKPSLKQKSQSEINGSAADSNLVSIATLLRKLKPESLYQNLGPEVHPPTKVSQEFEDSEMEIEIFNDTIDAPLGIVFDILFGSNDTSFQRRFLGEHDASEIDEFKDFHPLEDEPTKLERTYTYRRALGYSIGPKSTKCVVSEVVEHLNYADYIVVINTTSTPDVPSGGSFCVKTRFYFSWGEANTTQLRIAYFVKWSGRSWIRNVVEKLTLSAQIAVTKDMIKELNEEIDKHTTLVSGPVEVTQREPATEKKRATKQQKKKKTVPKVKRSPQTKNSNLWLITGIYLLAIVLMVIVYVLLRLVKSLGETRELISRQLILTTSLINLVSSEEQNGWWKHTDATKQEQASYLAQQALLNLVEKYGDSQMKELASKLI